MMQILYKLGKISFLGGGLSRVCAPHWPSLWRRSLVIL